MFTQYSDCVNFPLGIYGFVFIGLIFGGETILVPIVYYSLFGPDNVSIWIILILATLATIISDSIWYAIGRSIRFQSFLKKHLSTRKFIEKPLAIAHKFVSTYSLRLLFLSKFIYGTRITMQIISGMYKTPFLKYQIVNTSAIVTYFLFITALAYITGKSSEHFFDSRYSIYIGFIAFVLLTCIAVLFFKKYFTKK